MDLEISAHQNFIIHHGYHPLRIAPLLINYGDTRHDTHARWSITSMPTINGCAFGYRYRYWLTNLHWNYPSSKVANLTLSFVDTIIPTIDDINESTLIAGGSHISKIDARIFVSCAMFIYLTHSVINKNYQMGHYYWIALTIRRINGYFTTISISHEFIPHHYTRRGT